MKELLKKVLKDDIVGFTSEFKGKMNDLYNSKRDEMKKELFSEKEEED